MSAGRTGCKPMFLLRYAFQPHVLAVKGEAAGFDDVRGIDRHDDVVAGTRDSTGAGILERVLELESHRVSRNGRGSFGFGRGAVAVDPGSIKADLHLTSGLLDAQLKHRAPAEKFL